MISAILIIINVQRPCFAMEWKDSQNTQIAVKKTRGPKGLYGSPEFQ